MKTRLVRNSHRSELITFYPKCFFTSTHSQFSCLTIIAYYVIGIYYVRLTGVSNYTEAILRFHTSWYSKTLIVPDVNGLGYQYLSREGGGGMLLIPKRLCSPRCLTTFHTYIHECFRSYRFQRQKFECQKTGKVKLPENERLGSYPVPKFIISDINPATTSRYTISRGPECNDGAIGLHSQT